MTSSEFIERVSGGAHFEVNFIKRIVKLNRKIVLGGKADELSFDDLKLKSVDDFLETVTDLYEEYKYSVPSERSESRSRGYFSALREDELSDEDMMFGKPREVCMCRLELEIISQIFLGFKWDEKKMGKWFWQGNNGVVLLRDWFENKNN